jgi:hypothetical protein
MDSLKSLLDKKQYDLILSLTEGSLDPEALVYRISAYLGKGDSASAQDLFFKNRDLLWSFNPVLTIKSNFELRFIAHDFDGAYDDITYFENKPYVSQEVEEYLRDLPKRIRLNEKNQQLAQNYTPEKIEQVFRHSDDDYEVLNLLNYLQGANVREYLSYIKELLVSSRHPSVKTYALLLLVEIAYPESVTFNKNGKVYHLVPKDLMPPYSGTVFNDFVLYLRDLSCDPSVAGVATNLLNDYIMDVYPESVVKTKDDTLLALAFIKLAREYLRSGLGMNGYYEKYHLDEKKVAELSHAIDETLKAEPPLKI